MTQHGWWGIGIPLRPSKGTYTLFDYQKLPPLKDTSKFDHLKSLEDVALNKKQLDETLRSPTACSVDLDLKTEQFYVDQQDCVRWYFAPKEGVYAVSLGSKKKYLVAPSLAEFFTRLWLESRVFYALLHERDNEIFASHSSLFGNVYDAKSVLAKLQPHLSPDLYAYVKHYDT